jgi:hypothetical protein
MRKLVVPVVALAGAFVGMGAAMGSPADTFSRSPAAGPPGSTITVASVTPCPESPGQKTGPGVVSVGLVQRNGLVSSVLLPVSNSGRWRGAIVVGRSATPGPATLQASCLSKPPSGPPEGLSAIKTLTYDDRAFTVTARPTVRAAPPARPVTGVSRFTG